MSALLMKMFFIFRHLIDLLDSLPCLIFFLIKLFSDLYVLGKDMGSLDRVERRVGSACVEFIFYRIQKEKKPTNHQQLQQANNINKYRLL